MPGISLQHTSNTKQNTQINLDKLLFFDEYYSSVLHQDDLTKIGFSGYSSYPITSYESDAYEIYLEGYLYSIQNLEEAAHTVAEKLFSAENGWVKSWLRKQDAEFVLIAVEKSSGDIAILNDALSRLPVYIYEDGTSIYISRELGFILESSSVDIDSMGVAQQLLFGYPLGERTLYSGVHQLSPASVIRISNGNYTTEQLFQINIEDKKHRDKSIDENAAELSKRLSNSCRRRVGEGTNIVSLSGGMDSRAIAACLTDIGSPFVAATYNKGTKLTNREAQAAEEVMETLGGEWYEYRLGGPSDEHRSTLLETKRGMNTLGLSYILEFFEELQLDFGDNITYFTGDGGAKLASWTPPRQFSSNNEIVEYLLADQVRIPIDKVADLSAHNEQELRNSIHRRLESYPETDPAQRYVHFMIRERSLKWGVHGEDRNRYYFWSAAPLYSYPIFEYAMNVPDNQKEYNDLYQRIISQYSSNVLDVTYINFGAPIGSLRYKLKENLYGLAAMWPTLREKLIRLLRGNPEIDEDVKNRLQNSAQSHLIQSSTLSAQAIHDITNEQSISPKAASYLETATASIHRQANKDTEPHNSSTLDP